MRTIEEILAFNAEFVEAKGSRKLPGHEASGWAVVCGMEPPLALLVPRAMGFRRQGLLWISNAGGTMTASDRSIERSVAVAALLHGVRQVAVVGNTASPMAGPVMPILDAMQAAGVDRNAVPGDVREWLGMLSSVEGDVRETVAALARCPVLPAGVEIHGLTIDIRTGRMKKITGQERKETTLQAGASASERLDPIPAPEPEVTEAEVVGEREPERTKRRTRQVKPKRRDRTEGEPRLPTAGVKRPPEVDPRVWQQLDEKARREVIRRLIARRRG